jgi:hypothetical protein
MSNLGRLPSQFSISIPRDKDGLIDRECPVKECKGYFKIRPGTGLKGKDMPCHCPYCGHAAGQQRFFTKAQIEYAKSIVVNQVTGALLRDLKVMEFDHRPSGGFGIGISMKVEGRPHPIHYYRERSLETEVVCDVCTLRYMIYGVFGFCPDCGAHNSLQILKKNFDLVEKALAFAEPLEATMAQHWVCNSLEDCVSAFDGFGRETCRVFSSKATDPAKAVSISFQNIARARDRVGNLFGLNFTADLHESDWTGVCRSFQKRHLLAHKMGVVDDEYIQATSDRNAVIGRKCRVDANEVKALVASLRILGEKLFEGLKSKS